MNQSADALVLSLRCTNLLELIFRGQVWCYRFGVEGSRVEPLVCPPFNTYRFGIGPLVKALE